MVDHPGVRLRAKVKETQEEFADMCGVSRFTICSIMNGRRNITPNMALRFEKIGYGKAMEWLTLQMEYDLERERYLWKKRMRAR